MTPFIVFLIVVATLFSSCVFSAWLYWFNAHQEELKCKELIKELSARHSIEMERRSERVGHLLAEVDSLWAENVRLRRSLTAITQNGTRDLLDKDSEAS